MSIFSSMEVSASALTAERQRAEIVAANIANAETTRTPAGGPYRRKQVVFASQSPFRMLLVGTGGLASQGASGVVRVSQVVEDPTAPAMRFEPGHPDADANGNVAYPAINPIMEMVDMMGATRAYQLNASAISASKQMIQQALDILR